MSHDEPKLTDRAAMIILWHRKRFLTLYRNKWENEGTPMILPGGGVNADEIPKHCVLRELKEETGITLPLCAITERLVFPTKWTKQMHVFEASLETSLPESPFPQIHLLEAEKFSGYIWLSLKMAPTFKYLMMPGLVHSLEKLGYL
jgi:8-oxo-dGTP pyrophosphatase MutT (NUDIX family)